MVPSSSKCYIGQVIPKAQCCFLCPNVNVTSEAAKPASVFFCWCILKVQNFLSIELYY